MRVPGFEPGISPPQGEVLTTILHTPGEAGYRFLYLSHAKRALYHLSYIPINTAVPQTSTTMLIKVDTRISTLHAMQFHSLRITPYPIYTPRILNTFTSNRNNYKALYGVSPYHRCEVDRSLYVPLKSTPNR